MTKTQAEDVRDRLYKIAYQDSAKSVTVRTDDLKAIIAKADRASRPAAPKAEGANAEADEFTEDDFCHCPSYCHEYREDGVKHCKRCDAEWFPDDAHPPASGDTEVRELREALRPFAKQADEYDARAGDPAADDNQTDWPSFQVADFRRARAVLTNTEPSR